MPVPALEYPPVLCQNPAMQTLLPTIAAMAYAAALAALVAGVSGTVAMARGERGAMALAVPAALLHAIVLWQDSWTTAGLNLSVLNATSLLGWLMTVMLLLAVLRHPVQSLGLVVFPFAGLALLAAALLGVPGKALVPLGAAVDIHVLSSVLAYAVLGLATAQALVLAWQESSLRRRRAGTIIGLLPPLQNMEGLLFQLLASGFLLLSLSLVTGWLFVENLFAQDLVHKTVLSMLAWVVFAALLIGRQRAGWRGRTAIRWTLTGFVLLALGYFGSKVVLEVILAG